MPISCFQRQGIHLLYSYTPNKSLQGLPSMNYVRQKDRRRPSVIYCPEACKEDMVHMSMMQDLAASEMDNANMLYNTDKLICRSIANFTDEKKQSDTVTVLSTAEDVSPELYSLIR